MSMMRNVIRKWRDSASLIILGKKASESVTSSPNDGCNYDVLVQTRTHSASFPNSVVFPGGVNEEADASSDWLKLIKNFGYSDQDFVTLFNNTRPITPIFRNNPVLRHVALRITAIRETFEEVGLLICSQENNKDRHNNWADICLGADVEFWQQRVSKNPSEFLNLCKEYNCFPDLWSIQNWSNWLTPTNKPHRFDTAFFVTALNCKPPGLKSSSEVVKLQWSSPSELLAQYQKKNIVLYPPQIYELIFLVHLKKAEDWKTFSEHRLDLCDELLYPVTIKTNDGIVSLLPGDDLFPANVNYNNEPIFITDKTILDLREGCQCLHRFEQKGTETIIVTKIKTDRNIIMGNATIKLNTSLED